MSDYQILSKIEKPEDLKGLTHKELRLLTKEIREYIIEHVSKTGGHLASNLGIVELTVALHRVFNSPKDKFIFDVGHQCYTHKILTGRKERFSTNRQLNGLSGFTRRYESEHDFVDAGHASTSISSALGILLGEELQGEFNYIIPVIGDASLTGGMAYEAMNHLGHLKKKMIVILNDNNMSIDSSVGAMSSNLSKLTTTKSYQRFKRFADWTMLHIPFIGKSFYAGVMRWKKSVKTFFYKSNIFTDLGIKYIGPIDGHNLNELERVLSRVKLLDEPVLIHIITKKGKGYEFAEKEPGKYHGVKPFNPEDGILKSGDNSVNYTDAFSSAINTLAERNNKIVAITAAMMSGTGLTSFFNKYPSRSFDVGITEEHAVTLASGFAISGLIPVVAIYSTFIQRSIDQIIHDIAIPGLQVIFALDRAGIVPADGEAHQGLFDIALLKSVPGIVIMAPSVKSEMDQMLNFAINYKGPTVIRYPKDSVLPERPEFSKPVVLGDGLLFKERDSKILIVTYGQMLQEAFDAKEILLKKDLDVDIYSMRFLTLYNKMDLASKFSQYSLIIVVEDGIIKGGVGEELGLLINSTYQLLYILGVDNSFLTHGTRKELKELCHTDSKSIAEFIIARTEEVNYKSMVERINAKW